MIKYSAKVAEKLKNYKSEENLIPNPQLVQKNSKNMMLPDNTKIK